MNETHKQTLAFIAVSELQIGQAEPERRQQQGQMEAMRRLKYLLYTSGPSLKAKRYNPIISASAWKMNPGME